MQDDHKGKDNSQFAITDQCTTNTKLRKLWWCSYVIHLIMS